MKLVSYDPKEVKNIPAFFNGFLEEYKNEKYLMLIFNDILVNVKDKNQLCDKYQELMTKLDLPFAYFPYYVHFNRILPDMIRKPSPRITVKLDDGYMFDIVQEPAYGMLVLDIEKLNSISFKFNEKYKQIFYIQELITKCHESNLYFSAAFFFDVFHSYELFNSDFKDGLLYPMKDFHEEKKLYFSENKSTSEPINGFLMKVKERYGKKTEEQPAGEEK